ncbi:hypothetical protein ADUPG1_011879 [Aduncisulcus paluster]|uniref:Uncharacterized protein n=1 Tax=Aduncisulcus paluster TaxID=2918883 RepID=A0ABQ5JXH7_9EUKA|nr:hypothetical protein ADUPG1_011879 [Aduncisulcus paluster]
MALSFRQHGGFSFVFKTARFLAILFLEERTFPPSIVPASPVRSGSCGTVLNLFNKTPVGIWHPLTVVKGPFTRPGLFIYPIRPRKSIEYTTLPALFLAFIFDVTFVLNVAENELGSGLEGLLFDSNPKDESVKGKKGIFRVVGSAPVMLHKFVSNEQLQKSLAELHSTTNATKHLPIRAKEKDEETWDLIPTSGGIGLSLQAQPMQKTKSWRLDALKQEVNSILGRDGSVSFNDLMEQTRAAKTKLMTVLKDIERKNDRGEWELKLKF